MYQTDGRLGKGKWTAKKPPPTAALLPAPSCGRRVQRRLEGWFPIRICPDPVGLAGTGLCTWGSLGWVDSRRTKKT